MNAIAHLGIRPLSRRLDGDRADASSEDDVEGERQRVDHRKIALKLHHRRGEDADQSACCAKGCNHYEYVEISVRLFLGHRRTSHCKKEVALLLLRIVAFSREDTGGVGFLLTWREVHPAEYLRAPEFYCFSFNSLSSNKFSQIKLLAEDLTHFPNK